MLKLGFCKTLWISWCLLIKSALLQTLKIYAQTQAILFYIFHLIPNSLLVNGCGSILSPSLGPQVWVLILFPFPLESVISPNTFFGFLDFQVCIVPLVLVLALERDI